MTALQYLVSKEFGCCTTGELMALSKADKAEMAKLKEYAVQEMKNRGIPVSESTV